MKKVFILIVALFLLCSIAFADGPTISLWGRTVLNVLWCSSNSQNIGYLPGVIYSKWGPDSWTSLYANDGMYMNVTANWDGPVLGYHLGFQFSNWDIFGGRGGSSIPTPSPIPPEVSPTAVSQGYGSKVHTLYGSVKVIPDMLTLNIGLISDSTYKYDTEVGSNWISNWQMGGLWAIPGAMLTFAPAGTGLSVSANYRVPLMPDIQTIDYKPTDITNGDTVANITKKIDVMASYSIFDFGTFTIGTTGVKGTGWWGIGDYPGRPIFIGTQLRMIENMSIKIAGSYMIPDDPTKNPVTFDLASITYKFDPFTFKIGGFFYTDLYNQTPVTAYRAAGEIDLALGDFFITFWGNYSNEYTIAPYFEGGPTIKYNPIGIQIGFYYRGDFASSYTWSVPIQIDFGF